ncbi:minor tail protein [Mycobacterium phage HINdeR]|uniref:DUF7572 domain-containing protein n=1 Tax=Mycobacterium phage HINdeR TaxID=1327770 RepID=R4JP13_9CAUD|nr:minor tail protein [Mycobacterium phage HINdeR]AGK87511.1 hypothetical protein PBI_HINDER_32 [Mycobacterium phage HINdeR]
MIATRLDTDMGRWADGTVLFHTEDGQYLAVEAQDPDAETTIPVGAQPMIDELINIVGDGRQALKEIVRPTVVFECNEEGIATSLTPINRFPAGTSHEDALAVLGYTVE